MKKPLLLLLLLLSTPCQLFAGEVEVLHWWAEGSEAAAIGELRHLVEQQGHHWKDFAVEGGAGVSAMAVLKIRAISGNPPTTAQLKGTNIAEWASLGFLSELDDIATEQQWDKALPPIIAKDMKYNGHYVAVPVNIHRVNWLWINPRIFEKAGATIPTTLDELLEAAQTIKAAGYTAIAHGGERWQDATVFESIALAFLGAKQYHKAFVEHDPQVLSGQAMIDALTYFKKLNQFIDKDAHGRNWLQTTEMLINNQAAMMIMGDWSKGQFTLAGKQAGKDYLCIPVPETETAFTYNVDSFVMFKVKNAEDKAAQQSLTRTMLQKTFQLDFNLLKGSIPVRMDMPMVQFDSCAVRTRQDFTLSNKNGELVPSWSHGMATTSTIQEAIADVVSNYYNSAEMTPEKAARQLARAVKSAM